METPATSFSTEALEAAQRAIASTLGKCEKVLPRLKPRSPQHTLLVRRIEAFTVALALIRRELES